MMEMQKCDECGELIQEREENGTKRKYFFKILVGDFRSKLYIPPVFVNHIKGRKCTKATLHSCTGHTWHMKTQDDSYSIFLENGWKEFVQYYSLEIGDFLLFRYNGGLDFDIKIFGKTGCERVFANPDRNERVNKVKEKEKEEINAEVGADEVKKEDDDGLPEYLSYPTHPIFRGSHWHDGINPKVAHGLGKPRIFNACYMSGRRPVTTKERRRTLEAAKSLILKRPHFAAVMRPTSVYKRFHMHIPMKFCREQRLSPLPMALRSPNGILYPVRISRSSRGRLRFVGGWGFFSLDHNLEDGDVCVFELLRKGRTDCMFKVHIFRVVEDIMPLFQL